MQLSKEQEKRLKKIFENVLKTFVPMILEKDFNDRIIQIGDREFLITRLK